MAILHRAKRVFLQVFVDNNGTHTKALFKRAAEATSAILHGGNTATAPPDIVSNGDDSYEFQIGRKTYVVHGTKTSATLSRMSSRGRKTVAKIQM